MPQSPVARSTRMAIIAFGAVMVGIGAAAYLLPPTPHWTALIPAILGGASLLAALLGNRPVIAACIVSVLAALALFGSAGALQDVPALVTTPESLANPAAVAARAGAAVAAIAVLVAFAVIRPWRRQDAAG